ASVPSFSEYTIIPESQQPSFTLSAEVDNNGSSPVTGVVLNGEVFNSSLNSVFNSNSPALPTLASGATSILTTANTFTPPSPDTYNVFYSVSINESDANPANDTISGQTITISDTTMARDNGTPTGALGIGAGVTGYLGNQFDISQPTELSSVSLFLTNQLATSSVGIAVFGMVAGVPSNLLYASPTLVLPTDTSGWLTFEVSPGTPLTLAPGTYLVAAVETDSTLALGITTSIFTPGTCWVDWVGNPNGTWTNVETFGANFARTFLVRANLQSACTSFPTVTASATNDTICSGDPVTLTYGGNATTYVWSNGVTNGVPFNPTATQTYTVTGTDANGCSSSASIQVAVKSCVGLEDILGNEILSVYPNPSSGIFQMQVKKDIQLSVYSLDGRLIQNHRLNPGSQLLSLENEASGMYIMQINTAEGQYRMKLIKE
ncbi:MAG: T9SS type A sorting domain-containing protein, partial [Bacteroidia bacterium]